MSIPPGTRLGPYEIIGKLGAGGMGEVYRGKDTRLDRIVAIKVLSPNVSGNPEFRQRFEREARAISSLSHSHICALHDIGHHDGIDFLVMEYLEGETLAQRLQKAALSTELVLRYGIEIGDALDKAHKQGIVHRDLKPGNIMLTKSGIKLLDFGLAKSHKISEKEQLNFSKLATEAHELTKEGTILGTLQYMAPEQLEGKHTDERTDIFAFGSILYEMITGKKAFEGTSHASLIASILKEEPRSISTLQPVAPPALEHVVKKCLAKDPEERWQSVYDIVSELKWVTESNSQKSAVGPRSASRERLWMLISGILFMSLIALAYFLARSPKEKDSELIRFSISPPKNFSFKGQIAISPDGKKLAFTTVDANSSGSLWVRSLNSTEAIQLKETEDASFPFWSPDSRYIAYFEHGKLKKIDIADGSSQIICNVPDGRGGSWSSNGTILLSPDANSGLFRVSSDGKVEPATSSSLSQRWPIFLPDGEHFLFVQTFGQPQTVGIYAGALNSKETRRLLPIVSRVIYVQPGYLLYIDQGKLISRGFDAKNLEFRGDAITLAPQPWVDDFIYGSSGFSLSGNGVLAYREGGTQESQFAWYDRKGLKLAAVGPPCHGNEPALSPDEHHIVFHQWTNVVGLDDEWLLDLSSGKLSRFTFDPSDDNTSVWSHDGSKIFWASNRTGAYELYEKSASGAGEDKVILANGTRKFPDDISTDGKYLIYDETTSDNLDLSILSLDADRRVDHYLKTPANEMHARFSPDGKWIAYSSDESGRMEIYVQGFPQQNSGKWQISSAGGDQPTWRRDGKELFYIALDTAIMSVEVRSNGSDFKYGTPTVLFKSPMHYGFTGSRNDYVVSADGQKFLINTPLENTSLLPITVVLNWTKLLQR